MPPKAKPKRSSKTKQNIMIPLECKICPKNPNFSDISHLLTHVSSKSHLASHFKLQIRATSDPVAQEILEEYHNWYQNNGLDNLLSERLSIKEKKNTIKKKNNEANRALVPQAKREPVNKNPLKEEQTPHQDNDSMFQRTPQYRAPVPRMHLFRAASGSKKGKKTDEDDEYDPVTVYETPAASTRTSKNKNNKRKAKVDHDTEIDDNVDPDLDKPPVHADSDPDSATKLKGIFWPGMDLFDSASTGMRRKRNQKKEAHVTEHMMAVSRVVAPNEVSYFSDWGLRTSKDMFNDPLSEIEFSPEHEKKAKESSPKKRKVRNSAMADVSVNVAKPRASRRAKAAATGSPMTKGPVQKKPTSSVAGPAVGSISERATPAPEYLKRAPILNPLSAVAPSFGNNVFIPSAEETLEFKMAIGNLKPKSPFGIFHDAPEQSPARTEASLEENRFDFPNHGLPVPFGMNYSSSFISPTPAPKISAMRFHSIGKEIGKSDLPASIQSVRRPVPMASHGFPPQVFHDAAFNPLFQGNHTYTQPFGYSDSQLNFKDNIKSSGFGTGSHSEYQPASSMTRATPPREAQQSPPVTMTNDANASNPSPRNVDMQFSMH